MARSLFILLCLVSLAGCLYVPDYALTPESQTPIPPLAQPTAIDVRTVVPPTTAMDVRTIAPSATAVPPTGTAVVPVPTSTLTLTPPPSSTGSPGPTTAATAEPTATSTAIAGKMNVLLLGCDTGIDLFLGEVTNIYTTIQNLGGSDWSNMVATGRASDEGKPHPDKTKSVQNLPYNWEITFKLTVDTTFKQGTIMGVDVTTAQGVAGSASTSSCKSIDLVTSSQIEQLISRGAHPIQK